ncbi:MAG: hypothetical protein ACXWQO_16075 [Bdellovibrionota bacterium]
MKTLFILTLLVSFSNFAHADDGSVLLKGREVPKPREIVVHEAFQPKEFTGDIRQVNRELRRDKAAKPLQWLKMNYQARGIMNHGQIECFKEQKAEFDKAMQYRTVEAALKDAKVPRMTYNLFSNSKENSVGFVWNRPRTGGAVGGNYLIVRFGNADGKCHLNSADDISAAVIAIADKSKHPELYKYGEDPEFGKETIAPGSVGFGNGVYGEPSPKMPAVIGPEEKSGSDSVPAKLEMPPLSPNRL